MEPDCEEQQVSAQQISVKDTPRSRDLKRCRCCISLPATLGSGRQPDISCAMRLMNDALLQNLSGSNIGEDASNVRNNLRLLAATELPVDAREAGRTEVLPVQWRKHLRLDASALACTLCHASIT